MVFHYKWPSEEIQIGDIGLQRVQSWQLKKKYLYPLKRTKYLKKLDSLARPSSQSYGFSSNHVWM